MDYNLFWIRAKWKKAQTGISNISNSLMMIEAGGGRVNEQVRVHISEFILRNATHEGPWHVQHLHTHTPTHINMQIDNCAVQR